MTRFSIRPYKISDTNSLYEAATESINEVGQWLPWCSPNYGYADAEQWVAAREQARLERTDYSVVIYDVDTGEFVGGIGLNNIDWQNGWANLGYWVRTNRMRQGAASSAVPLIAQFGFDELDLQRCEIVAATENIGSQRTAERAGATKEGLLRNRLLINGKLHDAVVFSLISTDLTGEMRQPATFVPQETAPFAAGPFTLRPYTLNDALTHYEGVCKSMPELLRWMPWCHEAYSLQEATDYCQRCVDDWQAGTRYTFAVTDTRDGQFVGNCALSIHKLHRYAEMGYWIRSDRTGQGAASTAIRLAAAYAFEYLELTRCQIIAAQGNTASQGAAQRAGARYEASLRNRLRLHNAPHDAISFSLIPSDIK